MVKLFSRILLGRLCSSTPITQKFSVVLFLLIVNISLLAQMMMLEFMHKVHRKCRNIKLMV